MYECRYPVNVINMVINILIERSLFSCVLSVTVSSVENIHHMTLIIIRLQRLRGIRNSYTRYASPSSSYGSAFTFYPRHSDTTNIPLKKRLKRFS